MPIVTGASRILVKTRAGVPAHRLAAGAGRIGFEAEPLFTSIGDERQGLAPSAAWHVLTPSLSMSSQKAWDLCHNLMSGGLALDDVPAPEFAEPDLQQQWVFDQAPAAALAMAGTCMPKPQNGSFPTNPNPYWHRDAAHGQFDLALTAIGDPGTNRVRVAHLDTGYDPNHQALPAHLNVALARNFVDVDHPNEAYDYTDGAVIHSRGHGTGTISVLAGRAFLNQPAIGAAPFAEVVPIRIADSVVLLFNTSAIARAFDYVHSLCADPATRVHVITMSMGGVASRAWADAVNALYEAGVFVVTAAGNNFANLPTHQTVFPARFGRVVAACGVMANEAPYADLGFGLMAGDYGPPKKMRTAISGYTPNIPWAQFGCPGVVNFDGAGTSCATPQVAAAAAIWIQRHQAQLDQYAEPWMRVEAVRKALFDSARGGDVDRIGRGELRVADALNLAPADGATLSKEPPDSAVFPILRLFFGQSLAAPDARQRMLELEALQLSQRAEIEALLPDPSADPAQFDPGKLREIGDALASQSDASDALRNALHASGRRVHVVALPVSVGDPVLADHLKHAINPPLPKPPARRLKVYAYDPSIGTHLETLGINEAVLNVRWEEELAPGPVGEYLEVIDVDPVSQCCYAPVDLNHPHLLVRDGLRPSEANPQFHQQMVYATAMTTIEHFERALGRVALWAPRETQGPDGKRVDEFVQRLRIYPHALRTANSFYSPERKALLLGYFTASETDSDDVLPGGLVFCALSHDIVAHETTHALLDGLHRRFREPTNPDVLAFHEAFADVVALFQHFTMPEALRQAIAATRGDLRQENLLAQLAVEFGHAEGYYGALRDAIGHTAADNTWVPAIPTPKDYGSATEPHTHGSVLVAAVFDAFLQIYRFRTTDLVRLATGGTGVLPPGNLPVDLVERMAAEASKAAAHVLAICIRALDYCPPVDITFGEYLRALITADRDLVPDDQRAYRVAFIAAFRARGIYPSEVKSLAQDSLVWEPPPLRLTNVRNVLKQLNVDWDLDSDRRRAYEESLANARTMHRWLMNPAEVSDEELTALGLRRIAQTEPVTVDGIEGDLHPIEVHSVRPARRVAPDGRIQADLVVEITQTFWPKGGGHVRSGCTLLIDLKRAEARYFVRKRADSADRIAKLQGFALETTDQLPATYFMNADRRAEPFALIHREARQKHVAAGDDVPATRVAANDGSPR